MKHALFDQFKTSIIKMNNVSYRLHNAITIIVVVVVIAVVVQSVKQYNMCSAFTVGLTDVWYTVHSNVTYVNNCYVTEREEYFKLKVTVYYQNTVQNLFLNQRVVVYLKACMLFDIYKKKQE